MFSVMDGTIVFVADRLRRERSELWGELDVRCVLRGVRTPNGSLMIGSFNFSNPGARKQRAQLLAERARTREIDWFSYLEEFAQRVLAADREGEPAIVLRDVIC